MRNYADGFTLIELLVVIAIIGILAAVLIPNILNARRAAMDSEAVSATRNAVSVAEMHRANQASVVYPTATNCFPAIFPIDSIKVASCSVRQDANASYVLVESTTAHYYYYNGERLLGPLNTAPNPW